MDILYGGLSVLFGYLFGSISVAVLLSRAQYHTDVRNAGSGNAGATNVARVFGMRAGVVTFVGDLLKTALSCLLGFLLFGKNGLVLGALGCAVGHCWPLYFSFRGGKGVTVAAGIALFFDFRFFLLLVLLFFSVYFLSHRVSVCSVISAVVYPLLYLLTQQVFDLGFYVCIAIALIVLYQHRGNIRRILRGEEPKFEPGHKH